MFTRIIAAAALTSIATAASWLDVPFVRQEKNACGAAGVWMLIAYWRGPDAPGPAAILRELYSPGAAGIRASDMERYLRREHFETFAFQGEWTDLEEHIAKGRPLLVSIGGSPAHYVVVAGVSGSEVAVNDPARRKLVRIDRKSFERDWNASGRWTLLAVPK